MNILGVDLMLVVALGVISFVVIALAVSLGIIIAEAHLGFRRKR